jgi:hypothetical protein
MARLFLHIGTHKTGTTSIQYYLNFRKKELLDQGILSPDAGKPADSEFNGNHRLAWAIQHRKGEISNESWNDLQIEIDSIRHEKVVLSSEAFCKLNYDQAGQVKQLLKNHEVFIIVYFRNYKDYFRSVYAQVVWNKLEIRSFSNYVLSRPDLLDFDNILRNWGENFGYDHLIVHFYDEVISKGKLLKDFSKIIGFLPPENDCHFELHKNSSPDEKTINAMRLINLCRTRFPFLIKDQTCKNLKNAYYYKKNRYARRKLFFMILAKNHYFTRHAERLIAARGKEANKSILKNMLGQEGMKYLER